MPYIIGIDLGTSNTVAAVVLNGKPTIIPSQEGDSYVPSIVAINARGERLVGKLARSQAAINPENTIFSIKRFMGRKFNDPTVQTAMNDLPYSMSPSPNGDVYVRMVGVPYTPQQISALILQKIKASAEAFLNDRVTEAVITVPASFNNIQRRATSAAGRIAGLKVIDIINEPTAAALAYGLDSRLDATVLVFSLGGGTCDVSVLEIGEGVVEVKSTSGEVYLGGDDYDQRIVDWMIQCFQRDSGIDLSRDRQALQRLKEGAEKAKIELSSRMTTEINLPFITFNAQGPLHLHLNLSRQKFEHLTKDLTVRLSEPVHRALRDAELRPYQIDRIILVGGSTRMPAVQALLRDLTGKEPIRKINVDDVVAMGAAIRAGLLRGKVLDMLLLDVTSFSLGIETMGGWMSTFIERNTTIPTRKSQLFRIYTNEKMQRPKDNEMLYINTVSDSNEIVVKVYQGEHKVAANNVLLIEVPLEGNRRKWHQAQIEVTLEIDAVGLLKVLVTDPLTKRQQRAIESLTSDLSDVELGRLREVLQGQTAKDDASHSVAGNSSSRAASQGWVKTPTPVGAKHIVDGQGLHVAQTTTTQRAMPTVFISYAHRDGRSLAEQIDAALRKNGFNTWWDDRIKPGEDWDAAIWTAVDRSNIMILVLTKAASISDDVKAEWRYALDTRQIPVIPFLAPGLEKIPPRLSLIQYIDGRLKQELAIDRLVAALHENVA